MQTHPDYVDAAILLALDCGGSPDSVIAATDHINAGYADYADWVHACDVLGRRGLIAEGQPLPTITTAGECVVVDHGAALPPRHAAAKIRDALATLPIVAEPVSPPEETVIERAIATHREQFWG